MTRQIILDTETTGLEPEQGHRIIEIGCVEMIERRLSGNNFHVYLQPDREIDAAAVEVHGITCEFLADKPRFADIVDDFLTYVRGAEVIIHNAPFDTGFVDAELSRAGRDERLRDCCSVTDTLVMARELHPGQRNSLDALCGRYQIDNSQRQKHGALLDAEILGDVYLAMTGGQKTLSLEDDGGHSATASGGAVRRIPVGSREPRVVRATAAELLAHEKCLDAIGEAAAGKVVWRDTDGG